MATDTPTTAAVTAVPDGPSTARASTRPADAAHDASQLVEEELLVEEVSIDGMCGVY